MAIAFRSGTNTTYASRTNTVLTAPSGLANDDILILTFFQSSTGAPTPPSGFTAVDTGTAYTTVTDNNGGGATGRMYQWWKRASGESGSYTVTHGSRSSQGRLQAYSGCIKTGSPIDVFSKNTDSGGGTTTTYLGVTTTVANTMLLGISHDWEGLGALTPPTGFTERFDSLVYCCDAPQASAGASGNKTQTNANGGDPAFAKWAAWLIALKPDESGGSSQDITGALYTNSQTFYAATVNASYNIAGSRLDNANTFYNATVAPGAVNIAGSLYTDPDTFYAANVVRGPVSIDGSLFTNANVFYGSSVSATYTIQGGLFTDGDTFYGATVSPGAVNIGGALFSNSNPFYGAIITQDGGPQYINAALYSNAQAFYGATVAARYSIAGGLFQNQNTFFAATVSAPTPQTITATRYDNDNLFFAAVVGGKRDSGGSGNKRRRNINDDPEAFAELLKEWRERKKRITAPEPIETASVPVPEPDDLREVYSKVVSLARSLDVAMGKAIEAGESRKRAAEAKALKAAAELESAERLYQNLLDDEDEDLIALFAA